MPAAGVNRPRESNARLALRFVSRFALLLLLFLGAGTFDWPRGWIFVILIVIAAGANYLFMRWKNPDLVRARLQKNAGVKPFDKAFFAVAVPLMFLFLITAGLAERFRWAPVPVEWLYLGVLLHVLGMIPILAAIFHNPFLELAVRIQEDRGHRVVTTGPYRFVRHPMYLGFIVMFAGWPLVLGSYANYVTLALTTVSYIVRTALEDRTLRRELPGYDELCRKTPYRLVPGVW
jgi:protein-S-isoprenylcysteine O-methyltransferase Ste14